MAEVSQPLALAPRWRPAWPQRMFVAALAVLFFGPLIAPLFQASQLPLLSGSGALARDLLARYICPTPAKSYMVAGFPMAVCARCWGATIGLWAAWLISWELGARSRGLGVPALRDGVSLSARLVAVWSPRALAWRALGDYLALAWPLRLLAGALPFLLWVGEIHWWAAAPYWVLLLNGALAGFWAGLFFCSIWPGLLDRPFTMAIEP